ncbi:MAG: beta-galactosidase, partial [Terriglobia bacterium]
MKNWTRRDLLKTSLLAPAAAAVAHEGFAGGKPAGALRGDGVATASPQPTAPPEPAEPGTERERLLLDFGWRFHFGNADNSAEDFGFGKGRSGNFQKTGGFITASALAFDDSNWRPLDLPHDWAVELPFQDDPALTSKGSYPLGRAYPATSVGWYRRVFDLPATDAGKRIFIE